MQNDKTTIPLPADWPEATVRVEPAQIVVTHALARLVFPYHLKDGSRAYIYASIDAPTPRYESLAEATWTAQGKPDALVCAAWWNWLDTMEPVIPAE